MPPLPDRTALSAWMRAVLGVALLFATIGVPAGAATAPAASPEIRDLDRVIAVVNDDVITETELNARLAEAKIQLAAQKIALPPENVLRRQVLERLVTERIELQHAAQVGIHVTDAEVDQAIENIARRNNLSVEELRERLRQQGITAASHRQQVRNQLVIQYLQEREVGSRVMVSDAEIENFLANQDKLKDANEEYDISQIFIAIPENASAEAIQAAKKRANDVHEQLLHGGDFAHLALTYSQGSDALNGGHVGWKKSGELPGLFLDALRDLPTGGVSDVIQSPNGFHILHLIARRGGAPAESVTQTHVRHILVKPSEILSPEEARQKILQLRERIANGDDFAALARAHSEDPGSAANGGDLGWANPGQFVPEFEKAMDALKPGELSQPVRSSFGYHLIQVLGRRERDVSQDRRRAAARAQIQARKIDERFEQWLRELRDQAYVEYRLDDDN
jgi:peptidyl-prolyl cis-trans isomerase SurA